jgi:hypothetical protein
MKWGGDRKSEETKVSIDTLISLEQAADLLNVGRATVARVKAVERAAPELVAKIERGEAKASAPSLPQNWRI